MKRVLKWVLGAVVTLMGLLLVAAAAAMIFIDPNDYRDAIADNVKEQTGRDLQNNGEINLSLFPWLGLELGEMELGNASGFAEKPFARIEAAEARVKLMPLLKLQTEIDTVLLRGLELNLHRRADGVSNWDDLAGDKRAEQGAEPAEETVSPADNAKDDGKQLDQLLAALAIGGIALEEANVSWQDDVNGQKVQLQHFNLKTGEIRIGNPVQVNLTTDVNSSQPAVEGKVKLSSDVTADPMAQRFHVDGMSLGLDFKGDVFPGGKIEATLTGDAAADLKAQSATLNNLMINAMGLSLTLQANGEQIIDQPRLSGKISSNEFVPRQLLEDLGIALPEMADPATLIRAKLASDFTAGTDRVALNNLSLQMDDTTFSGKASVSKFATPVIRYDLVLDEIDVDRYLPPYTQEEKVVGVAVAANGGQAKPASSLPLALLRSLDIDGSFKVGKVKVMNLRSDTIVTKVKAKQGKLRVHPLSANLYQGSYSGNLGFDVSGKTPVLSMDEKLSGVQSGPLMQDFMGKPYVTGEANMAAKMTARGMDSKAIRKSLNGNGSFSFRDGTVNGVNIGQLIRKAYALYKKQPTPAEEDRSTDFANLSGSFKVKNGLVSTRDLNARSPLFQVDGKGTVSLPKEKLNLRLDTTIVSDIRDATGESMGDLRGQKIPVTIKGTFSDPKFGVDVGGVLEAKAKAEVEKKKKEAEAEVKKEIKKKQKNLEKELEDKLKNLLKF